MSQLFLSEGDTEKRCKRFERGRLPMIVAFCRHGLSFKNRAFVVIEKVLFPEGQAHLNSSDSYFSSAPHQT